jgi:hypothetical protein
MVYNKEESSRYLKMAGRISAVAAIAGVFVFLVAFVVDLGSQELSRVSAQTASTSLTVLNTPPEFAIAPFEVPDSATATPINSGDTMTWQAVGTDSNGAPYFLIICSDNATPTPDVNNTGNGDGNGPPQCRTPDNPIDTGTAIQWGVSASTTSGEVATVSTTTASTSISQFAEVNEWYAWVCDDDFQNPRCSNLFYQGPTTTTASSSPFHVNNRPNLVSAPSPTPADPDTDVVFTTVSEDPDTAGGEDELIIVVCQDAADYNPTTNDCDDGFLASTTLSVLANAAATLTLPAIIQDDTYPASVFLIDEHGHEALENPISANFVVNNVPPEVVGGDIFLQAASTTLELSVPGGQTEGFTLDFTVRDANSCVNVASTSEIVSYAVALFRDDLRSTTTCDGVTPAGQYNPNNCYTTGVPTTTWNLSCTAATSSCTSPSIDTLDFNCTFPLWFVADPTDSAAPTAFDDDIWSVGVAGIDDNNATSSMATTTNPKDLESFTALDLLTVEIPYGSLEPGQDTQSFNPTSTVFSVGNTGLDQEVSGEAMCELFAVGTPCTFPYDLTETIPETEQQFSSSSFSYGAGVPLATTTQEVELNVAKSISTSSPNVGDTYWGIAVPLSISLSGPYRGLNTFIAVTAEPGDW